MTPLLCVGEYGKDKAYGVTPEVLRRQLKIGLFGLTDEEAKKLWIAYEPVWAIGESGTPAAPDYVEKVHGVILLIPHNFGDRHFPRKELE